MSEDNTVRDPAGQALVSDEAASRIAEVMAEGDGFWRTCSGCYESEDGYPVGHYSYSTVFRCELGGGCGECGGIGATWDTIDYADMADWMLKQDRTEETIKAALVEHLQVFDGRIIGLSDAAHAILSLRDSDGSAERQDAEERLGPKDDSAGRKASPQPIDIPSEPQP